MSYFDLLGWIKDINNHYNEWKPRYYSIVGFEINAEQTTRVDLIINADVRIQTYVGMARFPIKLPAQFANHGQYYVRIHADMPSITLELEENDLSGIFDIGQYQSMPTTMGNPVTYDGVRICFAEYVTFIDGLILAPKPIKI